jgi:hypothetical protein
MICPPAVFFLSKLLYVEAESMPSTSDPFIYLELLKIMLFGTTFRYLENANDWQNFPFSGFFCKMPTEVGVLRSWPIRGRGGSPDAIRLRPLPNPVGRGPAGERIDPSEHSR